MTGDTLFRFTSDKIHLPLDRLFFSPKRAATRVLPRLTMEKEKEKEKKTTTPAGSTRKKFSSTGEEDPSLYKGKGLEKHPLRESTRHV